MEADVMSAAPKPEIAPPVHPAANAFRMMDDEELQELAESIKEVGLLDRITLGVVNGERFIVDGRNRRKACELAGVAPKYEEIPFQNEDELRTFVAGRNERRSITKGQKAMAVAMLFPDSGGKGGRGKKDAAKTSNSVAGFSGELLRQARAIFSFSPELAGAVRDGVVSLKEAFDSIAARQRLQQEAPDLALRVKEESLPLPDAIALLDERLLEHYAEKILGRIRTLQEDVIEYGRLLVEAKESFASRGIAEAAGWLPWLDREFGWTDEMALGLMKAAEEFARTGALPVLNLDAYLDHLLAKLESVEPAPEAP
jgi:hypothetical protein